MYIWLKQVKSKNIELAFSELNALWGRTKLYEIVKGEQEELNALKVAGQQLSYEKKENARN